MKKPFTLRSVMSRLFVMSVVSGILLYPALEVSAQISMTVTGNNTQNFNTLATTGTGAWTDNSTIANWYWQKSAGGGTFNVANDGSSTAGTGYSYGTGTNADRAMGSLGSGTPGSFAWGALLRNNSASTITNITIAYTGEQWRNSAAIAQTVAFMYKTSPSTITALEPNTSVGWTAVTALDFTSPITGGTAGALDGNAAANRSVKSATAIPSLSLAAGDYIMIKWHDIDHPGTDHGFAIDDVTIAWTVSATAPSNDLCANSIAIPASGPFPHLTTVVDNTNATNTGQPAPSCQALSNASIWYTFTPACSGNYRFSTCPADAPSSGAIDHVLWIGTGACGGAYTQLACNDDIGTGTCSNGTSSVITVALTASTTYRLVAYTYDAVRGNIQIQTRMVAPTITSFSSANGCIGSSLTITGTNLACATAVTIGGTAATITGNTATTVTVTVGSGTTGFVVVTSQAGTVSSSGGVGTFTVPPAFNAGTVGSGDQTICSSTVPDAMSVTGATGSGSFSYQWYSMSGVVACPSGGSTVGWTSLGAANGANTATYTPVAAIGASTTYACFVTPGGSPTCGTAQWATSCRKITFTAAPSGTFSYAGTPYCSTGGTATVTPSSLSSGGTYSSTGGLSINAATGAVNLGASTAASYTVNYDIAAGDGCPAYNTTASITINTAPSGTFSYTGTPYCSTGGTATVTGVALTGGGTYSSTGGLSINTSTGAVDLGASTAASYTVNYDIAAGGGCAAFNTSAGITIVATAPAATAGGPQTICQGGTTTSLGGNTASPGTGAWSVVSGGTGSFSSGASPSSTFTHTGGVGPVVVRWTITNAPCASTQADVTITIVPAATANANGPYNVCDATAVAISATASGAGTWSGGAGTFASATSASTTYTPTIGEVGSAVTITWTTTGTSPCPNVASNATVNVNAPATANANGPYTACGVAAVAISATANGAGTWSGGAGTFASATSASTTYTPTIGEVGSGVTITWTTTGTSPCPNVPSNATVNVIGVPVATAATSVSSAGFTANWGTVSGATDYRLDVYTLTTVLPTELLISEYVEGSGSNKYIEIFNGTGATVDLSNYELRVYFNGNTTWTSYAMTGTLANISTIVYRNSSAAIYGGASTVSSTINFNGDDAFALYNTNTASFVDIIGEIGNDPGTEWVSGGHSTLNKTLRRKSTVSGGVTTNPTGLGFQTMVSEWDVFAQDVVSGLGSHTYNGVTLNYVTGYTDLTVAGTSLVVTGANIFPATTYYYVVRAVAGACTSANSNEITVTTDAIPIYYSQASGNVTDNIWDAVVSGSTGPAVWTSGSSMVVQAGHTVTNTAAVTLNNLTVDATGTLVMNAFPMNIAGSAVAINGTLTANASSTLALNSSSATTLSSVSALSLANLTINTSAGTSTSATIAIRGTLKLQAGAFDASGGTVSLASTASGTGRLGIVESGASYTGNLTVNRYIPAGATNWRLLGSAVTGQTVNDWKDDFYTAGFPGAHSPGFSSPPGSGHLWPSVRWYNEPNTGVGANDTLVGATSNTQSLAKGQGFACWSGDNFTSTAAFTVDVTGNPHVAITPFDIPVSYTNTANPTIDGYNLVSNPLASPVRWSNLARTNVEDYITYFNPASGNTATYDISLNAGTNGGTDIIQSSQAFFIKANAASPVLSIEEADKVSAGTGGLFGGMQVNLLESVRLNITSDQNSFSDETIVVFNSGSPATDGEDVLKFVMGTPGAPQIASVGPGGEWLAINAYGAITANTTIPVSVNATVNGMYTITASSMENLGLLCVALEDLNTGTTTILEEGATYSFAMLATDDETVPRFVLHTSAPVELLLNAAICHGEANGAASIVHSGDNAMDIVWMDAQGNVLLEESIESGMSTLGVMTAGNYMVTVNNGGGCGVMMEAFTIDQPDAIEVIADIYAATCVDIADGGAELFALGGTEPFEYQWSNGNVGTEFTGLPGSYELTVIDANGCMYMETIVIGHIGPMAAFQVASTTVTVNTAFNFTNTSENGDDYLWDFGDGNTSTDQDPSHMWTIPGMYEVSLMVNSNDCSDTYTMDIVVETSTSVSTATAALGLNAWFANDKFVIEHAFDNGKPVLIEVLDATGRLHAKRQVAATPGRVNVNAEGLPTGIWFVRISNDQTQRTLRIPLVR